MFDGARRSDAARASVIGPNGKPLGSSTTPSALTPLRPRALADFVLHLISAGVLVPLAILSPWVRWSPLGLGFGLAAGLAALGSDISSRRGVDKAVPTEPGAEYESTRLAVLRGVHGAYLVAGQSLLFGTLFASEHPWTDLFFGASVGFATVGSAINLITIVRAERRLGGPLVQRAYRGQSMSLARGVFVVTGRQDA